MAGKLVTIATFELPLEAHIARNALEAAKIPVTLNNEESSTLFGQGTNLMSGVQLIVREEDEEAAAKVLDATFGKEEPVTEEEVAACAAAEPEDAAPADPEPPDEPEPPLSVRDADAHRFFRSAVFGLLLVPFWLYAIYLFLNAAFGEGPLSARGRNKLLFGIALLPVGALTARWVLFRLYGVPHL